MMDVVFGIAILVIVGAYVVADLLEHRNRWREEDADDAEFDHRRARRQARIRRQNEALAKRVLIEQCENIYIGRWQS